MFTLTDTEKIERLTRALEWLLDDLADSGEDRNPDTGEFYDSVENALKALGAVRNG